MCSCLGLHLLVVYLLIFGEMFTLQNYSENLFKTWTIQSNMGPVAILLLDFPFLFLAFSLLSHEPSCHYFEAKPWLHFNQISIATNVCTFIIIILAFLILCLITSSSHLKELQSIFIDLVIVYLKVNVASNLLTVNWMPSSSPVLHWGVSLD